MGSSVVTSSTLSLSTGCIQSRLCCRNPQWSQYFFPLYYLTRINKQCNFSCRPILPSYLTLFGFLHCFTMNLPKSNKKYTSRSFVFFVIKRLHSLSVILINHISVWKQKADDYFEKSSQETIF